MITRFPRRNPKINRGLANRSRFLRLEQLEDRSLLALLGQELFPASNAWNQNIASAPVAANSAAIISNIVSNYGDGRLHPDFGQDSNTSGDLYGIPYNVVHGNSTPKTTVVIDAYADESDLLSVPIPTNVVLEGDYQNGPRVGVANRGDSHLIIYDVDNNIAYEFFYASRPSENSDGKWHADQQSVWDMNSNSFRTIGYTSADAAGLSILAGLIRPDEGLSTGEGGQGVIDHAIRMTLQNSVILDQFIYPASHVANSGTNANILPPMGARFRLKSSVDISQLNPESKIIAQAMKDYGLIIADNGSNYYISGAASAKNASNQETLTWNDNDIQDSTHGLKSLRFSNFEVVDLTPIVTDLSVHTGPAGTSVTVIGQNFSGAGGHLQVLFGNTPATSVTVIDDSHVVATVPTGSGTVNVRVQSGISTGPNPDNIKNTIFGYGISTVVAGGSFTYGSGSGALAVNVTSTKANGTYTAGTVIDVTVAFNVAVNVTGTPQLQLETGTTDRLANYLSGSGTSTLTFRYTVQAGDTSGDLDYNGTGALSLNGGTIKDAGGTNATLTLAVPGTTNSLGTNKNLVIDTTAPVVTDAKVSISGASGTGGAFKVGDTVTTTWNNTSGGDNNGDITGVKVNFSQFGGGSAVTATNSSGTWTATYTLVAGSIDGTSKNVSVSATDNAGNVTTTSDTTNATVDNQLPVVTDAKVSISGASGTGGAFKVGDTVTTTWNNTAGGDNNGDITGVKANFSQFGGGSAVTATNSSGTWTATYTIVAGSIDGTNKNVSVTATDNAGNVTTTSDTTNATVDNQPPTISSVASSNLSAFSATVSWTTSQAADSQVDYGTSVSYGSTSSLNTSLVTSHSVNLTGLAENTTYHYRVRSRDDAGNLTLSSDFTFTTLLSEAGLVAKYTFNEGAGTTVIDASGNNNLGTLSGASWTSAGKFGNGLSFNGTSSRVDVLDASSLDLTTGMTLEAWVNPASLSTAWQNVIYKGDRNYYLMASSSNGGSPVGGATKGGVVGGAIGPAALPANTWSHLAATYDGQNIVLYVNGVSVASIQASGSLLTSVNPLQIGGNTISGQYFSGLIDEVRIYNRALSQAEIQSDMSTAGDTTAPTISGVGASNLTETGATVAWTTSEAADTQVEYGTSTSYGSTSSLNMSLLTSHSVGLTGLIGGTTYHYRVRSRDGSGNLRLSSDFTFTTAADTIAPTISGIATSNLSAFGVTVAWTTSEGADTQVEYGTSASYGSTSSLNTSLLTSHSVNLTGLTENTTYHYRVRSRDAAGNLALSSDSTFTTPVHSTAGLVAEYTFNEGAGTTVIDASGNNNLGTISGAAWTSAGKFGSGLSFNGTSSRVDILDSSSLDLTSGMTLEAWVNPASLSTAWQNVIYKGDRNYYLMASSSNGGSPVGGATKGGVVGGAIGPAALPANIWSHLAATYDGQNIVLYVNGVSVASIQASGSLLTSVNPLQIGGNTISGQYFKGLIDEVRIYNRALSQAEIQSDMSTAGDMTAPAISGVATSNLTASGATVTWSTSEAADSQVDYGTSTSYGSTSSLNSALVTGHTVSLAGLAANTTYHYRVRSRDLDGNLTLSGDSTFTTVAAGLVAQYTFNEGSGTTVIDASGNGNLGTLLGATWTTGGKYGNGLSFDGTSSRVDILNSSSLQLTSGMTLEAWVNPADLTTAWQDIIYKGDRDYYLMASSSNGGSPVGGNTKGGVIGGAVGPTALPANE